MKNTCPECGGKKGTDGDLTGYWIDNAWDPKDRRWIVCEYCRGTGVLKVQPLNKSIEQLISDEELLQLRTRGNA
jgi:hypothetical protein